MEASLRGTLALSVGLEDPRGRGRRDAETIADHENHVLGFGPLRPGLEGLRQFVLRPLYPVYSGRVQLAVILAQVTQHSLDVVLLVSEFPGVLSVYPLCTLLIGVIGIRRLTSTIWCVVWLHILAVQCFVYVVWTWFEVSWKKESLIL